MRKYYFYEVYDRSTNLFESDMVWLSNVRQEAINDLCDRLEKYYPDTAFLKLYLPGRGIGDTVIVSSDWLGYERILPVLIRPSGKYNGRPCVRQKRLVSTREKGYTKLEINRNVEKIITKSKNLSYYYDVSGNVYRFGKDSKTIFQSDSPHKDLWRTWLIAARYL